MEDPDYGAAYSQTSGFPSPAQNYLEQVPDMAYLLDLHSPGVFAVRVEGSAMSERGIRDGDILIASAAVHPAPDCVAVVFLDNAVVLATTVLHAGGWCVRVRGKGNPIPLSDHVEIWAIVTGLVRTKI